MISSPRIWLITGVSGGLGRALALEAAQSGDIVFGTLRKPEQIDEFNDLVHGKTFGIELDINKYDDIGPVVTHIIDQFGKIDVLVNNAGYGLFGAVEEVSMTEARAQMETNFFGALAMTQAILPVMRSQKSGHILQVSSIAGISSNPGLGMYNASKFALEGLSEALAMETKDLNIKVTLIEPGPFRTDWAGSSSSRAARIIPEYDAIAGEKIRLINGYSGQQPGDPVKAAKAIITIVNSDEPPLRLALGKIAVEVIRNKIRSMEKELDQWEELGANTGFEE
ncbi:MAG: oxidoreductase [Daejeonella sp.]|uniref:oxidoreductase n=1 Tax=Daejeonella sp. TaxID=2805397 RepID=UPI003C74E57E